MDFPLKPKGQLQKENDEKFMELMKKSEGKAAQQNGGGGGGAPGSAVAGAAPDSSMYEMLQEYMIENETLRFVLFLEVLSAEFKAKTVVFFRPSIHLSVCKI